MGLFEILEMITWELKFFCFIMLEEKKKLKL